MSSNKLIILFKSYIAIAERAIAPQKSREVNSRREFQRMNYIIRIDTYKNTRLYRISKPDMISD